MAAALANSCQIFSYIWTAPATVTTGSVFAMNITGTTSAAPGLAWAVFQVPIGFEVLGAGYLVNPGRLEGYSPATTDPAALSPYTASPGQQLFGVSGQAFLSGSSGQADVKVYLRAPTAPGNFTLRMALAVGTNGTLQPQLGLVGFQTPGGSVNRSVQVQAVPPQGPFAVAAAGPWNEQKPRGAAAADLDGDGRQELLLAHANEVRVLRRGPTGMSLLTTIPTPSTTTRRIPIATGDLDADGFVDVVVDGGAIAFGGPGLTWTTVGPLQQLAYPAVAVGDFDGDGVLDLAFAGADASGAIQLIVWRGLGNRSFAGPTTLPLPTGQPWLLVDDFDGDGRSELVVGNRYSAAWTQFWHVSGAGTWTQVPGLAAATGGLVARSPGQPKELLLGDTSSRYRWNGSTLLASSGALTPRFDLAAAADFDRDGLTDLLCAENSAPLQLANLRLWRQSATGLFVPTPLPTTEAFRVLNGIEALSIGDFDGDTWPDAFAIADAPLVLQNSSSGAGRYGDGCGGGGRPAPGLQALGTIGSAQPVTLQVAAGQPNALALLWIGNSARFWLGQPSLPFSLAAVGAPGCTLLAEPLSVIGLTADAAGLAAVMATLPTVSATQNLTAYLQAAVLDVAANPLGARFSAGLAIKIH
jgi:hypothetical protein